MYICLWQIQMFMVAKIPDDSARNLLYRRQSVILKNEIGPPDALVDLDYPAPPSSGTGWSTPLCIIQVTPSGWRRMVFFRPSALASKLAPLPDKKIPLALRGGHLLPDLDSNQDKQNQNLSYYHYTIRQNLKLQLTKAVAKGVQK